MPTTIELSRLPAGFAMRNCLPGQETLIATTEFYSSEDGNDCIMRLDGISNCYESFFTARTLLPSQVDHFVAIVTKDKKATIYCNELNLVTRSRVKRPIKSGEGVWKDDIADIDRMDFRTKDGANLTIPADCGVAVIFSVGWRKGVFYDYDVFRPEAGNREIDLPHLFGQFYARLFFQELFSITEEQWTQLNSWGWFPFIALSSGDRQKLISWTGGDLDPTSVLEDICNSYKQRVDERVQSWTANPAFASHLPFFNKAKDGYLANDYLGCVSILYPRIEGIMRQLHLTETAANNTGQQSMVDHLASKRLPTSLLLPTRFKDYLLQFYFRGFDPKGSVPLSRHTLAHGVADAKDCDLIRATLGFLIVDQLFYYTK
jgi:hypothetical protein